MLKRIDWGDGKIIEYKTPDLSQLATVLCPIACFPEGDAGTGQVVDLRPRRPEVQAAPNDKAN
jgi:hypothetical protein